VLTGKSPVLAPRAIGPCWRIRKFLMIASGSFKWTKKMLSILWIEAT
jgi:hypothetical protein